MKTKILVIEDDADINKLLCRILEREGHQTIAAYSGSEANLQLKLDTFDLIMLDLMLPGISGEDLIASIRTSLSLPIIVVSARTALEDKVNALKIGADDYITKPFERDEVLARVEALLRRSRAGSGISKTSDAETCYTIKNLILKPESREVLINGSSIYLTAYEYDILFLMLQYPEKVFTKEQLYQEIWKTGYYGEDNTINVHISNIRKKIKEYDDASYIKTIWGIGFKIDPSL